MTDADNGKGDNIVLNHIIQMSHTMGTISGEITSIKNSQEIIQKIHSDTITEIKGNIGENRKRIESLEKTRSRAKYTISGAVATSGIIGCGVGSTGIATGAGANFFAKILTVILGIFGP